MQFQESARAIRPTPAKIDPFRNPSYPKRTHYGEQAPILETLRSWEKKFEGAMKKLQVLGSSKDRPALEKLYHQAQGARDQLVEAARRLPLEAGALYEEDRERLRTAEAALARLARKWEAAGF